ncbi:MAG TPA: acyl-CoA desaturase [Balneolaceae bacterium]|nr:acyl-CoA desaturase [Balneolaceae bacterium]|tara:strand:+ start:221502 stop:222605 length:1104 start_codon:yes stop_codon:yes gene_type:complete
MPSLVTFNNKTDKEFSKEVKARVNQYFEERNLSKHANFAMYFKTFVILSVYWGAYALIMTGQFSLNVMWLLAVVMGIGMAGIGFSITHDALHGAYSSKNWVNSFFGIFFDLVGANGYIWKITHNIIHHTYTNIHGHDEDLEVAEFIRLSPHSDHKPIHRLQHILAFPAYSFATFFWVFIKDYWYFIKNPLGPYEDKKHPVGEWVKLVITKIVYYTYIIALPLMFLDITWWQWLIGFTTLHLVAGLILGIIFQLAHVVESTTHPIPNEDNMIENHWTIHEMLTTNNFARSNKFLCWYVGGLNFQIEHHLFPKICSIHYPEISPIVEEVAKKHGVPYNCHETFSEAVASHYRTLKKFGDPAYTWSPATA